MVERLAQRVAPVAEFRPYGCRYGVRLALADNPRSVRVYQVLQQSCARVVAAVSYTHLDVYKRQIDICGVSDKEIQTWLEPELHEFAEKWGRTYDEICAELKEYLLLSFCLQALYIPCQGYSEV